MIPSHANESKGIILKLKSTILEKPVCFSPDGKSLATGSADHSIKIWNVIDDELISSFKGHSSEINSLDFSPDGKQLASGSKDQTTKLWNIKTGTIIRTYNEEPYCVNAVSFSPDGSLIASGNADHTINLWNKKNGELIRNIAGKSFNININSISFSPDGRFIASGSDDSSTKLWNVKDGSLVNTFKRSLSSVSSVVFSPDGRFIASGSYDSTIKLWNVKNGSLIRVIKGHSSITSICFSPDGRFIVSGTLDNTINLWNIKNGTLIRSFVGHTNSVTSVCISPDGSRIASGSWDTSIRIWNINNEKDSYIFALLPNNEWLSFKSGQLFYKSSLNGDKYAVIGYDNNTSDYTPLFKYRHKYKKNRLFPQTITDSNQIKVKLYCMFEDFPFDTYDFDEYINVYVNCEKHPPIKLHFHENFRVFTGTPSCSTHSIHIETDLFKKQTISINQTNKDITLEMQFKKPVLYVLINPSNQLNIDPLKSYAPNFEQLKNKLREMSNQLDGNKRDYWDNKWLRTYFYKQHKGYHPDLLSKQGIIATKWDDPAFIRQYNKKIYFYKQGISYQQLIDDACTFFDGFSISDELNLKGAALFIIGEPDSKISDDMLIKFEQTLNQKKVCALIVQFGKGEQDYTTNKLLFKYLKLIQFDMKKEFYQKFFQGAFDKIVNKFETLIDTIENK